MMGNKNYKEIIEENGNIVLKGVTHFHPKHIFECGQCFRWHRLNENDEMKYQGIVQSKVLEVHMEEDQVTMTNLTKEEFLQDYYHYFDFTRDYGDVKQKLQEDSILREAMEFGYGIRVLNQDPFETLISFILSSNNLITKIKDGIKKISKDYGKEIFYEGKSYYAFPTPKELSLASEEDLRKIGVGYRAKYIYLATKMVVESLENHENLISNIYQLKNLSAELCHKALLGYPGVGPKVADCVMLFSMEKSEAFPVDVWVKKAMTHFYGSTESNLLKTRAFGQNLFGAYAGFAQQYLFYYAREKKIVLK